MNKNIVGETALGFIMHVCVCVEQNTQQRNVWPHTFYASADESVKAFFANAKWR